MIMVVGFCKAVKGVLNLPFGLGIHGGGFVQHQYRRAIPPGNGKPLPFPRQILVAKAYHGFIGVGFDNKLRAEAIFAAAITSSLWWRRGA